MFEETLNNNEISPNGEAQSEALMDLDFTKPEITPAEAAQDEKDKTAIVAALAEAKGSYGWDDTEAHRRGFN